MLSSGHRRGLACPKRTLDSNKVEQVEVLHAMNAKKVNAVSTHRDYKSMLVLTTSALVFDGLWGEPGDPT